MFDNLKNKNTDKILFLLNNIANENNIQILSKEEIFDILTIFDNLNTEKILSLLKNISNGKII